MSILAVLLVMLVVVALFMFATGKRSRVNQLIDEVHRTDEEEELARAEEEVRDLDVLATPEDAIQALPDWGPGAPRNQKRS